MDDVSLHRHQVLAFCDGKLDRAGQEQLALQMARVLANGPLLPNEPGVYGRRVIQHLGGVPQLLQWLSGFPGEPALLGATVRVADVLGVLSANDAVVDAIRELRLQDDSLGAVSRYLTPDTDHETLSELTEGVLLSARADDRRATLQLDHAALDFVESALRLAESRGHDMAQERAYAAGARGSLNEAIRDTRAAAESDAS